MQYLFVLGANVEGDTTEFGKPSPIAQRMYKKQCMQPEPYVR